MRLVHVCCALALALPISLAAADGEGKGHDTKKEAPDAMKTGTKGTSEGTIVALEKGKLTLATADGNLLFMPHWKGGNPKDGGGMDKEMLAKLEGFKVVDKVKIGWTWEERRRIETIEKK